MTGFLCVIACAISCVGYVSTGSTAVIRNVKPNVKAISRDTHHFRAVLHHFIQYNIIFGSSKQNIKHEK